MKIIVEGCASYHSMAFKWCTDVIWNSLKTKTDEKFGKKEWVNQRIWSRLAIFRLPRSAEKGQHFQTGGKKNGSQGPTAL